MISTKAFAEVLNGLQQLRPMGKQFSESAIALAWHTFPEQAKRELNDHDLAWAAGQYLQDPNPPKDEAPHFVLLRYLYRVGDGRPRLDWGPRFPNGTPSSHEFLPRQQSPWQLDQAGLTAPPALSPVDHQAAANVRELIGGMN